MPDSLLCPRCNRSVSISDDAAGKRVQCPHCEQSFLAPGISNDSNQDEDDDDWLTLDDASGSPDSSSADDNQLQLDMPVVPEKRTTKTPFTPEVATSSTDPDPLPTDDDDSFFAETDLPPMHIPEASTTQNAEVKSASGSRNPPGPTLSPDEEKLLSAFTETAEEATPPKQPVKSNTLDAIRALGATAAVSGQSGSNPTSSPQAVPTEYASEYRVPCKTCGTVLYAKANQAGTKTKCGDCYSEIIIPQPPKVRKKPEIDIENAQTFDLAESSVGVKDRPDPFRKSADELLAEASREEDDSPSPVYDDTPNVAEWLKNVFGIYKDPSVIMHWLVISFAAALPTALLLSISYESIQLLLTIGMMVGGLLLGAVTVSCAFAILLSVANGHETVEEWPSLDIFQWFDELILVLGATGIAAIPMWSICFITGSTGLLGVFLVMFAIYLVLPFVLLSMLDMGSVFTPFSPELARSISKCQEEWAGFYFSSGILFICLFLFITVACSVASTLGIVASISLSIFAAFAYFGMMGRLAFTIGQNVQEPPVKKGSDRSAPTDSEQ